MSELILSLDVGGTKIAAGLLDRGGALLHSSRQPTPESGTEETVWQVIEGLLTEMATVAGSRVAGVGIASAGPVDLHRGTVSPLNIDAWHSLPTGFPLRDRVAALMPDVPIQLGLDSICMAIGEHWRGAGSGSSAMLGMVVSTGVGGGLVLDGKPYHGRAGSAGHVGHVVVEPDGPPCACGGRGCVEAIASGPRMVRWARENGWSAPPEADAAELAEAANAGDPIALRAFARGGAAVGRMIASVAAVCDLDLVVIGGGVAKAGSLLFDPVRAAVASHAKLDYLRELRVVPAALGGDAGLVGAAALVNRSWLAAPTAATGLSFGSPSSAK